MTDRTSTGTTIQDGQTTARLSGGAWALANALGLGLTFALFALVGASMEAMGAEHDTIGWGVPTLAAMVVGGTVFAQLRRRVLGGYYQGSWWQSLLVGVAVTAGFVAG